MKRNLLFDFFFAKVTPVGLFSIYGVGESAAKCQHHLPDRIEWSGPIPKLNIVALSD